jgi:hypothetical protein
MRIVGPAGPDCNWATGQSILTKSGQLDQYTRAFLFTDQVGTYAMPHTPAYISILQPGRRVHHAAHPRAGVGQPSSADLVTVFFFSLV